MEHLKAWLVNAIRTLVQAAWAGAVAKLPLVAPLLALLTPDQVSTLQTAIAVALAALMVSAVAGLVHWLSSRTGSTWQARLARWLGNAIMLGLNRFMPAYADLRQANAKPASVNVYEVSASGRMTGRQFEQPAVPE